MAESPRPPDAGSTGASEPPGSTSNTTATGPATAEQPAPAAPTAAEAPAEEAAGAHAPRHHAAHAAVEAAPTPEAAPPVAVSPAVAPTPAATPPVAPSPAAAPTPAATFSPSPTPAMAPPAPNAASPVPPVAPQPAGIGAAAAVPPQPVAPAGAVPAAAVPAQAVPPAVAAAEAMARDAAQQIAVRGRAWWGQLDPTGKRPTLLVAAALIALVIGSQFLNALVPMPRDGGGGGSQPAVGVPVDIGNGVRVTPPAGWVAVGSPMGQLPGARFQRGTMTVDVAIVSFSASPRELLVAYVNQVLIGASQDVKVSEPDTVRSGNGRPTARSTYTASFKDIGTAVGGELSTQVFDNGIGIIVNGYAPQGQLAGALSEVHEFVDTIEVRQ